MARCGCGGGLCNCAIAAGENVTVTGTGSTANPYTVSADVPCAVVRSCFSAGPGITLDQASGVVAADLSGQAGNNLVIGPDGGLLVPTAGGAVLTGCGLTGDGSGSAPLQANTGAWPYGCSPDTAGTVVVCDSNGVLRGEPRGRASFESFFDSRDYPDLAVPSEQNQQADTFTATVTNSDPCRPALMVVEREADVWFVLPAGAGAAAGYEGDEMVYTRNTGSSSIVGQHSQMTKVVSGSGLLGPGASTSVGFNVTVGRGSGGAYYYRIESVIRVLMISL